MKFSVSNLAFKDYSLSNALKLLQNSQITGLEIAPTLIWEDPTHASGRDRKNIRDLVSDHGLSIVALQSLLYKKPHLQLFNDSTRSTLLEYLKEMVRLCVELGGSFLSFGAPKNRKRGSLKFNEAISRAAPFFFELSEYAKASDTTICIEPVATTYDCDFITHTSEAVQLLEMVGHSHLKLLLDSGTLIINKEDCGATIQKNNHHIAHFHINDPHLFPPSREFKEHLIISDTLRSTGYTEWLTLEFMHYHKSLEQDLVSGVECYNRS